MKKTWNWIIAVGLLSSSNISHSQQLLNSNLQNSNDKKITVTNGTDVPEGKYPWFCSITTVGNPINATGEQGEC